MTTLCLQFYTEVTQVSLHKHQSVSHLAHSYFIFVSCIHRGQASSSRSHPCYSASKKRTNYKHTKVFKSNWCTVLKCSLYNLDHNTDSSPFLKYFCDIKKFSLFLSVMLCYGPLIFEIPLLLINAELVFLENNLLITALS